jgi:hypothetical protein
LRTNCKRPSDIDKLKPFSGSIFFVQPYHRSNSDVYFIAFEDASLMLYDVRTSLIIEWFKRPTKDDEDDVPALLAIDSRLVITGDNLEARQFLISEPTCVYILYYDPVSQQFHILHKLIELKK